MKKVFVIASLSVFVLASCKKDYTCTDTDGTVQSYSKLGKTSAAGFKLTCQADGGTWAKK